MKQLFVSLLSGLCLTFVSINALAGTKQIDIGLFVFHNIEEEEEYPSKGNRIPAASVICTIDFENHRIATSLPYEFTTYELWDEHGETLIVSMAAAYQNLQASTTEEATNSILSENLQSLDQPVDDQVLWMCHHSTNCFRNEYVGGGAWVKTYTGQVSGICYQSSKGKKNMHSHACSFCVLEP